MLLMLLTAEDCGDSYSESQQAELNEMKMFDELQGSFVSDELDAESLLALEKRAIQKLQELIEYLNIYADSNLNVQFRKQALQMIGEAFISEQDLQKFFFKNELVVDSIHQVVFSGDKESVKFNIEFIQVSKAFKPFQDSSYKGRLTYEINSSETFLDVLAIKTTKSFGKEKLDVWELFFMIKDE